MRRILQSFAIKRQRRLRVRKQTAACVICCSLLHWGHVVVTSPNHDWGLFKGRLLATRDQHNMNAHVSIPLPRKASFEEVVRTCTPLYRNPSLEAQDEPGICHADCETFYRREI